MYDHTFYKQVQISRSDIRPHIKWAVSLVILHMITSIFLRALCGYVWVNILTLSPRGVNQLGVDVSGRLHTTELKSRILAQFPDNASSHRGTRCFTSIQG